MRRLLTLFPFALLIACGPPPAPQTAPPAADPIQEVDAESLFARGIQYAQSGDFVRAEQYLASSIQRGYPEREGLRALLHVCVRGSRLRAALDYAHPYLERHPEDWPLRFLLASVHIGLNEGQTAYSHLERVVREAPDEPDPHFLFAVVLRDELGNIDAATAHFERYLQLAPDGERAGAARESLRRMNVPVPQASAELPEPVTNPAEVEQ